jgi:signal transduction histidine kinase
MDPIVLARIQFAAEITFGILVPMLSIGLVRAWTDADATLRIDVDAKLAPPLWLYGLCVFAAALAIWAWYRYRLQRISRLIHLALDARTNERLRVALELHDTLLQSTQGLVLSMQTVAASLDPRAPVRLRIEALLDRAEEIIVEGRKRMQDLQASRPTDFDLVEEIERTSRTLSELPNDDIQNGRNS